MQYIVYFFNHFLDLFIYSEFGNIKCPVWLVGFVRLYFVMGSDSFAVRCGQNGYMWHYLLLFVRLDVIFSRYFFVISK